MHKSTVIGRLMLLVKASKVIVIITKYEHHLNIRGESMRISMMLFRFIVQRG